jgi:hypothetical protein
MRYSIFRHSSRSFQGTGFCQRRFGVDFNFPKNGMWSKVDGVLGILKKMSITPVRSDLGFHNASVIG